MNSCLVATNQGTEHLFECHPVNQQINWNDVPGVYMFAKRNADGSMHHLYIGQADSFKSRFSNHERWEEAELLGADHRLALIVRDASARDKLEKALIDTYDPMLNVHHRPKPGFQQKVGLGSIPSADLGFGFRPGLGQIDGASQGFGFRPGLGLIDGVRRGLL
ncbi:hypothetical protein PSQ39_21490 [Curvibacter sp. HBC28]|uniref:GIY-YIG domain-containing protein n=1 Tax=Curvibacter microcysteis TaxID=3026419 RepID=A0ABT5MKW8_9BURK|nr:hypothetical protein [Curvibacter sp. HBC28]MDD0817223.1 hypothetical protein [Curvibacter sp. HBC28]